jgi:sugar lactone lactonase YvrE
MYQFGIGNLYRPNDIAVDSTGNVYVADGLNHRVVVFDNAGTLLRTWGSIGTANGKFYNPRGIAVDGSGNVYVTDGRPLDATARVQVFSSTGTFITKWGTWGWGDGQFYVPSGIALDSSGNVYVVDVYNGNARVQVFTSSGTFITKWGSYGPGDGQFYGPVGIALDSSGNVYVVDSTKKNIQVFSSTGIFLRKWGFSCNNPDLPACDGGFSNPRYIAVDEGENVYVTDTYLRRVSVFSTTGTFLGKWGISGTLEGQFINPSGIAVDSSGKVYVSDSYTDGNSGRVQVFEGACVITANAGTDQMVEQASPAGAFVTLDGSSTLHAGACGENLTYSWSWPGGGSATGISPTVPMSAGTTTVTLTVTNGTQTATDPVVILVHDTMSPITTGVITGTTGSNGWYVSNVGISLTASDSGSGVKEVHYTLDGTQTMVNTATASFDIISEGTHSVSYLAIDNVNNPEAAHPLSIKIDKTPPVITAVQSPLPNANGWNNTDVTVTFTCSDAVSGIVSCPTPTTFSAQGAGQNVTGIAVDAAGNTATASILMNIDKTPPVVTVSYTPGIVPTAFYTVTDSLSGMASDSATFSGGDTSGAEVYTYAVKAADLAENTTMLTSVYNAVYNVKGLFTATDNWGTIGSDNGQFNSPQGIAVDGSGNVYVADRDNNRVQVFSSTGTFVRAWGTAGSGDGQLYTPQGIAVDSIGNVYVADSINNRIQVFSNSGSFLKKWGAPGSDAGQFNYPDGIAVDTSSNVYVADTYNNRVQVFSNTGTFLSTWGASGSGDGQFASPVGIAVDANGNVYVADTGNSRVQMFTSTGTFLTKWGVAGSGDGQFTNPGAIAVNSNGIVFVVDLKNRVQAFSSTGSFIGKWGVYGIGDGQFNGVKGLAVSSDNDVYVSDTGNNRVQVFSPTN